MFGLTGEVSVSLNICFSKIESKVVKILLGISHKERNSQVTKLCTEELEGVLFSSRMLDFPPGSIDKEHRTATGQTWSGDELRQALIRFTN